ncbi:class I adenylate-forming enzyme family protein [Hyphomonas sp.]|uniref:class I adenylate-forming enzyme family protein n=1 Tax=Hyphomonas sp. TaxID=87 RepID=UPI003F7239B4
MERADAPQDPLSGPHLIPQRLAWTASALPGHVALADETGSWTFAQLETRSRLIAATLLALRITPGDKVAILGENSALHMMFVYGVFRAGCCLVPLSTFLNPESAARIIDDADIRLVISTAGYLEQARLAVGMAVCRPDVMCMDDVSPDIASGVFPAPMTALPDVQGNWTAIIVYSSGTTGAPKGIAGSHALRGLQTRGFATIGAEPGRLTLLSTPLASNWTLAGLFATLWNGGGVYITRRFDAGDFLALAEKLQPKILFLVPTQVERLLDEPSLKTARLAEDSIKLCAGSPLSAENKLKFHDLWPGKFVEVYSMTESSVTCSLDVGEYPDKVRSVGKPAAGTRLVILDDSDMIAAPDQIGEITGWSEYMMRGYYQGPEATRAIEWQHADGTVFYRTGDLGFLDTDGFLYISGRKKDMIISGGFNVYPADLEQVLLAHPCVSEAAVIGLPSDRWGETPFAVITLCPDAQTRAGDILDWANRKLGKHQRLSGLDIADSLPRGSLHKVLKNELRKLYLA